jgi:hypothetical protein
LPALADPSIGPRSSVEEQLVDRGEPSAQPVVNACAQLFDLVGGDGRGEVQPDCHQQPAGTDAHRQQFDNLVDLVVAQQGLGQLPA